jgi:hypothetical protein
MSVLYYRATAAAVIYWLFNAEIQYKARISSCDIRRGRRGLVVGFSEYLPFCPAEHHCNIIPCSISTQHIYHILSLMFGASPLTWHLAGYRVRKFSSLMIVLTIAASLYEFYNIGSFCVFPATREKLIEYTSFIFFSTLIY